MWQRFLWQKSKSLIGLFTLLTGIVILGGSVRGLSRQAPAPEQSPDWGEAAVREANNFYLGYWRAWETRNLKVISDSLAEDFFLLTQAPGQGAVQVGKEAAVGSVRQFFAAAEGQEIIWRHSVFSALPRSPTEVILIIRTDFRWVGAGGQTELSLEVVRKDEEGRWQIVRKASERVVN